MSMVVGKRSSGMTTVIIAVILFFFVLFILGWLLPLGESYANVRQLVLWSSGGLSLGMLVLLIAHLRKPKTMIDIDGSNLFLHYPDQKITVSLEDIIQATPRRTRSRSMSYTFGYVIIHTEEQDYRIGTVSDCEEVCLEIMRWVAARRQ